MWYNYREYRIGEQAMGSGYKRLYEAAERENRLLTELSDAKGEMIEKLNIT